MPIVKTRHVFLIGSGSTSHRTSWSAHRAGRVIRLLSLMGASLAAAAAGLPEPPVVLYGVVTDDFGRRQSEGRVSLRFESASAGVSSPVLLTVALTNVGGPYSYVGLVPAETPVPGRSRTGGRLALTQTAETWQLVNAQLGDTALNNLSANRGNLEVSIATRGALVRLDLSRGEDTDGNGLVDAWERHYFGQLGNDPNGNPSGDGISNLAKMYAGLDPTGAVGVAPQFTVVQRLADGAFKVEWSTEAGRSYALERAVQVQGPYVRLGAPIAAAPPANRYVDLEATEYPHAFYRVMVLP